MNLLYVLVKVLVVCANCLYMFGVLVVCLYELYVLALY